MKPPEIKIAVITVNYNNPQDTVACIKSLSKSDFVGKVCYYVVNNGCTDNSRAYIKQKIDSVFIIESKKNLGFAGGNNLGINRAIKDNCTHILLLNNDTKVVTRDIFRSFLKSPYNLSSAALVSKNKRNPKIDYGGIVDWYFGRNTHRHDLGKIDYISGACFFAKTKLFQTVGPLDDRFFLYYEDVDYCLRAKKQGYTIGVLPSIRIEHSLSTSTNKLGSKKIAILAQSHLLFCQKHLSPITIPLYTAFNFYLRSKSFFREMRKS